MAHLTESERRAMIGLFVGQLSEEERAELTQMIKAGEAIIVYTGASGILGLGKVATAMNKKVE